jgi:hypothetical protein
VAPPFDAVHVANFKPALEAMTETWTEIERIANDQPPTFGDRVNQQALDRAYTIYGVRRRERRRLPGGRAPGRTSSPSSTTASRRTLTRIAAAYDSRMSAVGSSAAPDVEYTTVRAGAARYAAKSAWPRSISVALRSSAERAG